MPGLSLLGVDTKKVGEQENVQTIIYDGRDTRNVWTFFGAIFGSTFKTLLGIKRQTHQRVW